MLSNQPTGASLSPDTEHNSDALNELREQVAKLASQIEADGLSWENEYKQKLLREVEQRIQLRDSLVVGAAFVVVFMLLFAWGAYSHLTEEKSFTGAVKIGLFVTPIISATTIVVIMLVGAFKRAKDEDEDKVNLPSLFMEAFKASSK